MPGVIDVLCAVIAPTENLHEELLLAAEVVQQTRLAQATLAGDLAHRRAVVAGTREVLERAVQNLLPFGSAFGVWAATGDPGGGFRGQPFTAPEVRPSTI